MSLKFYYPILYEIGCQTHFSTIRIMAVARSRILDLLKVKLYTRFLWAPGANTYTIGPVPHIFHDLQSWTIKSRQQDLARKAERAFNGWILPKKGCHNKEIKSSLSRHGNLGRWWRGSIGGIDNVCIPVARSLFGKWTKGFFHSLKSRGKGAPKKRRTKDGKLISNKSRLNDVFLTTFQSRVEEVQGQEKDPRCNCKVVAYMMIDTQNSMAWTWGFLEKDGGIYKRLPVDDIYSSRRWGSSIGCLLQGYRCISRSWVL